MPSDREQLLREFKEYDAKVDIVSSFEVYFRESTSLPATVAHFERFPRYTAPDGDQVSPDFTVLFNDRPPGLYMATILWLDALPAAASPEVPPVDIEVTAADLAAYLRESYGWGDANAVNIGLEFLQRAGLARPTADGWAIELKEIAASRDEVHAELLRRHLARPTGPVTAADREQASDRAARDRDERERNEQGQGELGI